VLCSVVKHLGSRSTRLCLLFPLHFFHALPLPACFTTEQGTVEAFLFVKQKDGLTSFLMLNVLEAKLFQYGFLEGHNV